MLRLWGLLRAGLYCFFPPVVAMVAGYLVFGETTVSLQIASSIVLLMEAVIVVGLDPRSLLTTVSRFLANRGVTQRKNGEFDSG